MCQPIQYITGNADFMGLDFVVNKDVFIPRPETELLVKEVLSAVPEPLTSFGYGAGSYHIAAKLRILDLCTGSGNIAVSLALELPGAEIIATDISGAALKIARENSILHGVEKNLTFYKGDLFKALPVEKNLKFDIIVCNPPYVRRRDIDFLQKEVRQEPCIALDGGSDGLDFYRRITGKIGDYLKPGGSLFLEIGFDQSQDIVDIFSASQSFRIREIKKDFAGIDRMLWISLS